MQSQVATQDKELPAMLRLSTLGPVKHPCPTLSLKKRLLTLALLIGAASPTLLYAQSMTPHLQERHGAMQLIVDGRPFLVRGGELENSSASSLAYMNKIWPALAAMHFNTVIAPVYWQLIEPEEGHFTFTTVDGLIDGARAHHVKLVLLWFGTWKNSMSCYVPDWVKENGNRFPRAESSDGVKLEILSAVNNNNLSADRTAFAALMRHLKVIDGREHTVILVQVENEVGMILSAGGAQPRDYSSEATRAYLSPVPKVLTDYLRTNLATLSPWIRRAWEANGSKAGANWPKTFGSGPGTETLFTAWTDAKYTGAVAAAGKAVYRLPMYVNAALLGPGDPPGTFPNGAPLPQLFDIWRAAAPAIDFFSPDIYFPDFVKWASAYDVPGNPLFVPESGRTSSANLLANALYAYGELNSMGYSVYAPERLSADQQKALGDGYGAIKELTPLILDKQGTGQMVGIRTTVGMSGNEDLANQTFELGHYQFIVHFRKQSYRAMGGVQSPIPGAHGGIVIQAGPNDFFVAGTGLYLTFRDKNIASGRVGIDDIWAGQFVDGKWVPGRNLNGDDDNQGRYLLLPAGQISILRLKLYKY